MKVELLAHTPNALQVMYTAARTCYSPTTPEEVWEAYDEHKAENLLIKVLGSGHYSIAEHINFTFAISGASRAIINQLTRHRHASFSQQSTRYVEFKIDKEKLDHLFSLQGLDNADLDFLEKYFVFNRKKITVEEVNALASSLLGYLNCIKHGKPAEEARDLLPLSLKTNIVMTCNLRELIHICNLRLCTRAQQPIREIAKEMAKLASEAVPFVEPYLVAKCDHLGFCDEEKSCGKKPKLSQITEEI